MECIFVRGVIDIKNCIFFAANNTVPYYDLVDDLKVKRRMSRLVFGSDWRMRGRVGRHCTRRTEIETWEMPTYSLSIVIFC